MNKFDGSGYQRIGVVPAENAELTHVRLGTPMGELLRRYWHPVCLSIELEDNQLLIRGRQSDDTDRVYLHRGIAARQFQRNFVLAEGIEIVSAELDNGLLHVILMRPEPEPRIRKIKIKRRSTRGGPMDVISTARAPKEDC